MGGHPFPEIGVRCKSLRHITPSAPVLDVGLTASMILQLS